jgi:uncharacterized protein (DUF2237 family)
MALLFQLTSLAACAALAEACSYNGKFDLDLLNPRSPKAAPAILVGTSNIRCTEAAKVRLAQGEVCHKFYETANDPDLFQYMRCMHPESDMHSWVYFKGSYMGDGFVMLSNPRDSRCTRPRGPGGQHVQCLSPAVLRQALKSAGAKLTCPVDCSHVKDNQFPARFPRHFDQTIHSQPLALFGWSGCPCTNYAREHFQLNSYCYHENVWPSPRDKLFEYLQCRYGKEHHSFIFVAGQFMGNGFQFNIHDHRAEYGLESRFHSVAEHGHVRQTCPFKGVNSLLGSKLKPCTRHNDKQHTGWTRSGSCNWAASDSGYHEVCVEMTQSFLDKSTKYDGNDLSSVVTVGGHWCICAWAFASAVSRDPQGAAKGKPEGITLDCEGTNAKLRDVYSHYATLQSPTHQTYLSAPALKLANKLCPDKSGVSLNDEGGKKVDVTKDTTLPNTDPCYLMEQGGSGVTFPAFDRACPHMVPLPSACPAGKCAKAYSDWWKRCANDDFVQQIDTSSGVDKAFSEFAKMCSRQLHSGGH